MATGIVAWTTGLPADQKAKTNRLRQGDRALEDLAEQALAVRKNMAKLRELRLTKETEGHGRSTVDPRYTKQP
jgi:hypothetical protein